MAFHNKWEMCFTQLFFTLQVRYVRATSHGKAWIPVAKLCPWILGHLDGRAPLSGESIAEILLNQARPKLCTSKVASAAINSDWGDVSREVEDPYIGEWGSAWVLTNCSAGWSSRHHASVHKLAPGFQHLPSLNIQRFTSEIGTKWCHESTGEGQLENPILPVLVALTRKKNAQELVSMVVVPSKGLTSVPRFFIPGILLEVSDLGLQLSKEVANLVRAQGYPFFCGGTEKNRGVGRRDFWLIVRWFSLRKLEVLTSKKKKGGNFGKRQCVIWLCGSW